MEQLVIEKLTCARIPTEGGDFQLCLYGNNRDNKEHLALVMGDVQAQENVLVRVHSECFTGDVMGSRRCDCGQQLSRAMQMVAAERQGVILYLRQEGRGIGLLDKLRAYNLQDDGYDTVEANLMLGHEADERDYTIAAHILQDLGVRSLRLLTNNPAKIEGLQDLGVAVASRVPLQPQVTGDNAGYLATKVARMRHLLDLNGHQAAGKTGAGKRIGGGKRPFITLSYAQSLDGSITARQGQPLAISGRQSLDMTHQLRVEHDAILVGIGTVLADDPQLTTRLVDGRSPQPVILDSHLRFPIGAHLLKNPRPPWIITVAPVEESRRQALEAAGACVIVIAPNAMGQVTLTLMLEQLAARGITSLMVEGGAQVITSFLAARLVDRLVITVAPMLVGGLKAIGRLVQTNGAGFPRLRNPHQEWLGEDMVLSGDVIWRDTE